MKRRPRTRAEKKDATHARLLKVARRTFLRFGYEETSIALVCREARVTHGALYHHFPSKESLFAAVVAEVFIEVGARVSQAVGAHRGWAQVEAACNAYLDACTEPEVQLFLLRDGPRVLPRAAFDSIDHTVNGPLVDGLLERWMAEGLLAPRPVSLLARTIGAAFAEAGQLIHAANASAHVRAELGALLMLWISALKRAPENDASPSLSTGRLVLRPWAASDAAAIARLSAQPDVYRYLFDAKPPSVAWIRDATRASAQAFQRGSVGLWLARRDGTEVAGFVGFVGGPTKRCELVVATEPTLARRGYALEMAQAALQEASARRAFPIAAAVDVANSGSARLLEKLGFVQIGQRSGPHGIVNEYVLPYGETVR